MIEAVNIFQVWKHLKLPGSCRSNPCCSPFRDDNKPSFSIWDNGTKFNDFGTGEGGDVINFIQLAEELDRSEACKWLIKLYEEGAFDLEQPDIPSTPVVKVSITKALVPVRLPQLQLGTDDEVEAVAEQRGLSAEAIDLAQERRLLGFVEYRNYPAWVVFDKTNFNAQARRIDGCLWDGGSKVAGFIGNCASWPIGIREAVDGGFSTILLVEGTPDLLAAFDVILRDGRQCNTTAVCVTGATNKIHSVALPLFKGKRVRIVAHNDEPGLRGAEDWRSQLASVASKVDIIKFPTLPMPNGVIVKDLNDACQLDVLGCIVPQDSQPTEVQ